MPIVQRYKSGAYPGWRGRLSFARDRLAEIIFRKDFEFSELQGGALALALGVWFLFPHRVMMAETMYTVLAGHVFKMVWALMFTTIGVGQIYALMMRQCGTRQVFALAQAVLWIFILVLVGLGNWRSLLFPISAAFVFSSAWGFVRIGGLRVDGVPREGNTCGYKSDA